MSSPAFSEKLLAAAERNGSWLCVGLDPDPALTGPSVLSEDPSEWVARLNRGIIEATADLVCCYKPNLAFYEALGEPGLRALRETLRMIPSHIPVLGDAKRGDIGNTARAYAQALFEVWGFDAATVSPYLGGEAAAPFLSYPDKGVFVLCKTSNPSARELQDLQVRTPDGEIPLYLHLARLALTWPRRGTLGFVVGATYPGDVAVVRAVAPDAPILLPGVGAQAGDLEAAVQAAADARRGGVLVNASRAVMYASRGEDWQDAARNAARQLRDDIRAALASG